MKPNRIAQQIATDIRELAISEPGRSQADSRVLITGVIGMLGTYLTISRTRIRKVFARNGKITVPVVGYREDE